jgi:hypothetical protein
MWCCWIFPGRNTASIDTPASRAEAQMSIRGVELARLFSADEADSEGEGSALATGEGAEIRGVEIVDYRVGILAV